MRLEYTSHFLHVMIKKYPFKYNYIYYSNLIRWLVCQFQYWYCIIHLCQWRIEIRYTTARQILVHYTAILGTIINIYSFFYYVHRNFTIYTENSIYCVVYIKINIITIPGWYYTMAKIWYFRYFWYDKFDMLVFWYFSASLLVIHLYLLKIISLRNQMIDSFRIFNLICKDVQIMNGISLSIN